MDWDDVKPQIIARMKTYGGFTSDASLSRLYQSILKGASKIWRAAEWDWKQDSAEITTVDGTLGPYDAPATFYRLALEKKIYLYGYLDREGALIKPVLDSSTGVWDVIYRITDGKIYFRQNPGSGTKSLNFTALFSHKADEDTAEAAVELMPWNLYPVLAEFVEADFLHESDDTRKEALSMTSMAEANLAIEVAEWRKGRARQKARGLRGVDGGVIDGLGQQISVQTRRNNMRRRSPGWF